ncbi:hypothetical protein CTEN210_13893 [Chaetoceros tenuissimus]|uniref:Uncharacterized protein n=1 Tax=Chaetoceros tenuissimus TaxID=426638 RepID=A0AAD3D3V9_9STRA|nr:hypothetical protein CTEN210_13893 [Chaetoceros tenuissimus]
MSLKQFDSSERSARSNRTSLSTVADNRRFSLPPSKGKSALVVKSQKESLLNEGIVKKEKTVAFRLTFGDVEVRSHQMILGDNPAVSSGAPVTIDWDPYNVAACPIDAYEKEREGQIRHSLECRIPEQARFEILKQVHGASEITKGIKKVKQSKRERLETSSQLYKFEKDEKIEKLTRGLRNMFTNKKKKEREYFDKCLEFEC